MWVFLKTGFYSAVENYINKDLVHVRARFAGDLEDLCAKYDLPADVKHTPGNDYSYRMDFTKEQWSAIMAQEAQDINYPNYKDTQCRKSAKRNHAYMYCWSVLRDAQD